MDTLFTIWAPDNQNGESCVYLEPVFYWRVTYVLLASNFHLCNSGLANSPNGEYLVHMEITPTPIATVVTRNIKRGLEDNGITQNALAVKAGIAPTSLDRKLNVRPETFAVWELGDIAAALGMQFDDLIKDAA